MRPLLVFAVLLLAAPAPTAEPPRQILANKHLKLTIELPDPVHGYYRGTRFDWSGLVQRAEFAGHTVFAPWKKPPHDPTDHDDVSGTAEEFSEPLGYADAPVGGPTRSGETFLKIGVGELEKVTEPKYSFWQRYKIVKPGPWTVTPGDGSVEFRQEFSAAGYSYRYVKRVELDPNAAAFTIRRTLTNTGGKRIETSHYGHHFTTIDGDPVGPRYAVRFPFDARPKSDAQLNGLAVFADKSLTFRGDLGSKSVYAELTGFSDKPSDNGATIENLRTGAGYRVTGDRPLLKFHLWSVRMALCPEPFVAVRLDPGQEMTWANRYEFFSK